LIIRRKRLFVKSFFEKILFFEKGMGMRKDRFGGIGELMAK